jgi:hypothetical protein
MDTSCRVAYDRSPAIIALRRVSEPQGRQGTVTSTAQSRSHPPRMPSSYGPSSLRWARRYSRTMIRSLNSWDVECQNQMTSVRTQ